MNLLQRFIENVRQQHLFSLKDKLLVAVSGGVDSVVLCELCKQAGYDFYMAHCNFNLRGAESKSDELFVRALGKKYNVELFVQQFDTEQYAAENKLSTQEAARDLRYGWFKELINTSTNKPINFLLTAHHSDDNAETISMNFFRGTGLHGLTGIPVLAGYIRRPLLKFSKAEILDFAREQKLEFVEDSSNLSSKYTRNFFRNEIIPAISNVYPQVRENLQNNIERYKEIEKLYQFSVGELKKKLCRTKGNEIHIPVRKLMSFHNRALIYEIISPFGFQEKQVEAVVKLAESGAGKYIQSPSGQYRLIKHRHWFIISPSHPAATENIIIEESDKTILFTLGTLQIEVATDQRLETSTQVACLNAQEITFPLLLRKWKTGDYFYPLGMKKKKKLNRFMIDQKLSVTEKENTWVIESNQRILWVVGRRIDERFKVTEKTKKILRITIR